MSEDHFNEPRDIAYGKEFAPRFQTSDKKLSWTDKSSSTIFAGCKQADLFLFAMALGKNREKKSDVKNPQKNVPVSALNKEAMKWNVLSIGVSESNDLLELKNEEALYVKAEKYANEGMAILQSHIEKQGLNYPKFLEAELREIVGEK